MVESIWLNGVWNIILAWGEGQMGLVCAGGSSVVGTSLHRVVGCAHGGLVWRVCGWMIRG